MTTLGNQQDMMRADEQVERQIANPLAVEGLVTNTTTNHARYRF